MKCLLTPQYPSVSNPIYFLFLCFVSFQPKEYKSDFCVSLILFKQRASTHHNQQSRKVRPLIVVITDTTSLMLCCWQVFDVLTILPLSSLDKHAGLCPPNRVLKANRGSILTRINQELMKIKAFWLYNNVCLFDSLWYNNYWASV